MDISNKLIEEFFTSQEEKFKNKKELYIKLFTFLEDKNIDIKDTETELKIDSMVYKMAKERDLIGYSVLYSITNINDFFQKFNNHLTKNKHYIFHLEYERLEEDNLSLCEVWFKWNEHPPKGWFASWCKCGDLYPITFDIGSMNLDEEKLDIIETYKPLHITVDDIKEVQFCNDTYIRLLLKNSLIILFRPFKIDNSLVYAFLDNPLDLI